MSEKDLEAVLEILAEEGRADLDAAHGEHILTMFQNAPERTEAENRALLDALHQTRDPGGDDAA